MVEEALGGRDPGSAWRDQKQDQEELGHTDENRMESVHSVDKTARGASPKTGMGEGERCAIGGKELGAMMC